MLYTAETREAEKRESDAQELPGRFNWLRPWHEDPGAQNLFDVHWGIREELAATGITPKVGLRATSREFEQNGTYARRRTG